VVLGVELGVVLGVDDGDPTPLHAVPLMLKTVGAVLVPLYVKLAPMATVPPAATAPFQDALATVTAFPDCDHIPLQPLCSVWFPPYEYPSVQPVQAPVPTLAIVTFAVNPVPQSLLTE
jgi:hypothetical protein